MTLLHDQLPLLLNQQLHHFEILKFRGVLPI